MEATNASATPWSIAQKRYAETGAFAELLVIF